MEPRLGALRFRGLFLLSLVIYTLVPMKALRKSLAVVRCSKIPRSSPKPRKQAVKVNGKEQGGIGVLQAHGF